MIAVMGVVAVVVYERVGVAILRKAWLNLDHVWAGAFVRRRGADALHVSRASSRSRSRWISRWTSGRSLPSLRRPSSDARSTPISSRRRSL